jgi:endoglucanase Acf2
MFSSMMGPVQASCENFGMSEAFGREQRYNLLTGTLEVIMRSLLMLVCIALTLPAGGQLLSIPPAGAAFPQRTTYDQVKGPRATHRFWAAKNWLATNLISNGGAYTMFAEPLALQTTAGGLLVGASPSVLVQSKFFIHPIQPDLTIGTEGMKVAAVHVTGASDWTVDFDFGSIMTRVGRGMPFVYVITKGKNPTLTFVSDPHIFQRSSSTIGVSVGLNAYGLFCPSGGSWVIADKVFTCQLPLGTNFLSVALLPAPDALPMFTRFAFSFPLTTAVSWSYDEHSSRVDTVYTVQTKAMEGHEIGLLQALYPHQYCSLTGGKINTPYTFASARGEMKLFSGTMFHTTDVFHGILPFLPISMVPADLRRLRSLIDVDPKGASLFSAVDTYALGKALGRAAEILPLAEAAGSKTMGAALRKALEQKFKDWFGDGASERSRGFFYNRAWSTLIGYPAAYGSDVQLNDHHFHYGYWIHAAALLGLFDTDWLHREDGGRAVNWLVRDIATIDRTNISFPFLRHFDVFAGHSWASGQAPFSDGENEESSSEAVNAWASILLYAAETGDKPLRDAAIWMYTLETNAVYDYWFNHGPVATFPAGFHPTQIANLFDGKSDTTTWFGTDPAFEHGIEFLPFSGASLYLGRDTAYNRINLAEVTAETDGRIDTRSTSWPDLMEMYQALYDPSGALSSWNATGYTFDGESRAHEFAWITALQQLGEVDESVTADTPFRAVFRKGGKVSHVAFNLSRTPLPVTFSDGFHTIVVPASYSVNGQSTRIHS